jgi:hypothetical protein
MMAVDLDPIADPEADQATRDRSGRLANYWKEAIDEYKDGNRKFVKRANRIEQRYRDERTRVDEESQRRYNLLWSNTQVMFPAIYGKMPTPIAERRFKDKDPVGRQAAQMLERGLRNEVEVNGLHDSISRAVMDYLLPGKGVVWIRYEPEIEEGVSIPIEDEMDMRDTQGQIVPQGDEDDDKKDASPETEADDEDREDPSTVESEEKLRNTGDRIERESAPVDYVPWGDFLTFPVRARLWSEVVAVGKRIHMSRDQMKRRFGDVVGKKIPLQGEGRTDRRQTETLVHEDDEDKKGEVYEIWNRTDEKVYWVADGYDFLCDMKDDPLKLEKFFPVPQPLFANATNTTLIPVPFYIQYQDQAIQVDELTQRISMLSKACKVAGLYDASNKNIQRLFDESVENELIPVDNWAAFAEKGGVSGQMSFIPLKEIIGVINELAGIKEKVLAEADRLTGITDVMRGTTDARETMGGQRLKTNAGGTRISALQNEVARFCRDTVRLVAEVMSTHFSPQSLIEVSGALYEEGLGSPDMPPLSMFGPGGAPQSAPGAAAPPPGMPGQPPAPQGALPPPGIANRPPGAPSVPMGTPPQTGAVPPQTGGAPPPGQNVVPFQRPGLPAVQQPQGMQPPAQRPQVPGMPTPPPLPPEAMAKMEGLKRIAAAIGLLRDEKLRGFRVDIEVDSTVFADAAQEKQDRIEFIESTTKYLQTALAMSAQVPEITPLLGKLLQFGVRGFRVGRDLESAIEDFCDEAEQMAKKRAAQMQQQQGQPNPEQVKAQAAMATAQSDLQQAKIKSQSDLQQTQVKSQADSQQAQAEVQRQQVEAQAEAANSQAEMQRTMMDMKMRAMEQEIEKYKLQVQVMQLHSDNHRATMEALKPPAAPQQASLGKPL